MAKLSTLIMRKFRYKRFLTLIIKLSMISFVGVVFIHWKKLVIRRPVLQTIKCKRNIKYLTSNVAEIHDVILFPELATGTRKGGEAIADVKGQKEEEEYFSFKHGFLNVSCNGTFSVQEDFAKVRFDVSTLEIFKTLSTSKYTYTASDYVDTFSGLTVGIRRKDYANLYWTLIELYSAYMSARTIVRSSREAIILIMDAHPEGHLDALWDILFKKVVRVGWLDKATHFEDLAIVPSLNLVPIVQKSVPIPFMDDFRYYMSFLAGGSPSRKTNCKQLKITMVLRKNYVAHPRNTEGKIKRQLKNADVLIKALKYKFTNDEVRNVSFETLSVRDQVKISTQTDILIGVHGAGLAHTVFQVPGAGLIELFPSEYIFAKNRHFEELATWSGKLYASWYSNKPSNLLYVPPGRLIHMVYRMRKHICRTIR